MGKLGLLFVLVSSLAVADKEAPPPAKKPPPAAAAPKAVKQMSRAELEAEVEALRADNAKLRAKVDEMASRDKERADRMQKAVGTPATTLK